MGCGHRNTAKPINDTVVVFKFINKKTRYRGHTLIGTPNGTYNTTDVKWHTVCAP